MHVLVFSRIVTISCISSTHKHQIVEPSLYAWQLTTEKFVMADQLHVSTFSSMAVLVGICVVIYKWAAGPKPIET